MNQIIYTSHFNYESNDNKFVPSELPVDARYCYRKLCHTLYSLFDIYIIYILYFFAFEGTFKEEKKNFVG